MKTVIWDLSDPLSLNRYNYTKSNPLNYIDPSGFVYIIGWSYGREEVKAFEKYANKNLELSYKLDENEDTNDWTDEVYAEFDKRNTFARAAETKRRELLDKGIDEEDIVFTRIDMADDFQEKWTSWSEYEEINELYLFSHGVSNGPQVYKGYIYDDAGNIVINSETVPLETKLHFAEDAKAVFFGCNTGTEDFGQDFADFQNVVTYAQSAKSNFSHNPEYRTPFIDTITDFEVGGDVYQGVYKKGIYLEVLIYDTNFGKRGIVVFRGLSKNVDGEGLRFEPNQED